MRSSVILLLLVIALALIAFLTTGRQETFDDRFERADSKLDAMSQSIEDDLQGSQPRR